MGYCYIVHKAVLNKWRSKNAKPLLDNKKLTFKPDDIEFIITENNNAASELISLIMSNEFALCGCSTIDAQVRYGLISKIITKERITENF